MIGKTKKRKKESPTTIFVRGTAFDCKLVTDRLYSEYILHSFFDIGLFLLTSPLRVLFVIWLFCDIESESLLTLLCSSVVSGCAASLGDCASLSPEASVIACKAFILVCSACLNSSAKFQNSSASSYCLLISYSKLFPLKY